MRKPDESMCAVPGVVDPSIRVVREWRDCAITAPEWAALVRSGDRPSVFQTREWLEAWWEAFGSAWSLLILVAMDGDQCAGIAPLMVGPRSARRATIRFIGSGHADYAGIICGAHDAARMASAFAVALTDPAFAHLDLELRNVPEGSSSARIIQLLGTSAGFYPLIFATVGCPALVVESSYIDRTIAKYSLRRPGNYFARQGRVHWKRITDSGEASRWLPAFFEQHVERWRGTRSPSRFTDADQRAFFMALVRRMMHLGWIHFSVVLLDDQPLAFHFGFEFDEVLTWYKPAFAISHHKHSPGLLLVRCLLEYCRDHHLRELDFSLGDEDFKSRFSNVRRVNGYWRVYRRGHRLLLGRAHLRARGAAKGLRDRWRVRG